MLPFPNLTLADFIAPEAPHTAANLVPAVSGALRGEFANILTSAVQPAVLLPTAAGEELPQTGNPLPVDVTVEAPPHETDIEVEIPDVDLTFLGVTDTEAVVAEVRQPQAGQPQVGQPEVGLPVAILDVVTSADSGQPLETGDPIAVHVPPDLELTEVTIAERPPVADATREAVATAADSSIVAPPSIAGEAGNPQQVRDRALDTTHLQVRSAIPTTSIPVDRPTVTIGSRDPGVNLRHVDAAPDFDEHRPERHRMDTAGRAPATALVEPAVTRAAPMLFANDDAVPHSRPIQSSLSPAGFVAPDASPEPGARVNIDAPVAAPRSAASQPLPPMPQPAQVAQAIEIPVQQPGWDSALADRVTMMAHGRLQNAELRLSPAELGPLRIQLEIDDGVANVSFQSHHPLTRDALEQTMPRLRELLAENGLSLGQADVRDDSGEQKSRASDAVASKPEAGGADDVEVDPAVSSAASRRVSDGLIDTFA